jgi:hypothetical protein
MNYAPNIRFPVLSVAQWQQGGFGLQEGRVEIEEETGNGREITGTGEFLELAADLDHAFGSEIEAHAFQRVRVKG